MNRRNLDITFSIAGVLFAALILVLGLVLQNQANFAKNYVHDQLAAQKIVFTPVDKLSPEEASSTCLTKYASQDLVSGKQAECYANDYIALHLTEVNEGKTYAESSTQARALAAQVKAADPATPEGQDLATQSKALTAKVDTLFRGETLRGLLLTSYGFSVFGERAALAAALSFAAAALLFIASLAGFWHAWTLGKKDDVTPEVTEAA